MSNGREIRDQGGMPSRIPRPILVRWRSADEIDGQIAFVHRVLWWTNNNTLAVSAPVPYICPSIASPICTTGLPPEKRGTTASPIAGPVLPIGQPRLKIVSTTN